MSGETQEALDWKSFGFAFSRRLHWLRTERGWSQEKLAELAGLHRNQISNLERNQSHGSSHPADPLMSTVYRLARALDVAPEALMPDRTRRIGTSSVETGDRGWTVVEVELQSSAERTA